MSKEWLCVGLVGGAGACGYLGYRLFKANKLLKKIGLALDKMVGEEEKNIDDQIVEAAVKQAAENKVAKALEQAENDAIKNVKYEIRKQVKEAVEAESKKVTDEVSEEISKQAAAIDLQKLRDQVTEKAKSQILQKFDGSLDGILNDFNRNLGNVASIYEGIAKTFVKREDDKREFVFKI